MEDRPTQPKQDRTAKYLASPKGKAMLARKRQKEQEKLKALTKLKRQLEQRRRELTPARFEEKFLAPGVSNQEEHIARLELFYQWEEQSEPRRSEVPTTPDDDGMTVKAVCVQAGIPRWSESISNPAYRKRLAKLGRLADSTTPQGDGNNIT
jgi:hypothetical protein